MRHRGARTLLGLAFAAVSIWPVGARAEGSTPTFVWYRSAEGCPDARSFVALLEARGVTARIAGVGDPVDFVVTLGIGADGAQGLLEKQTQAQTVAIRRLGGGTCDEVADAIALSLVVARTPGTSRTEGELAVAAPPPHAAGTAALDANPYRAALEPARPSLPAYWILGFQLGAQFGMTPDPWPTASVFAQWEPRTEGFFRGASVRVAVTGAYTASSGPQPFRSWMVAGRLEGCPTRIGSGIVEASPCASFDLGMVQASGDGQGGASDSGLWAVVGLGARVGVRVAEPVTLELQGGAAIPLKRYEFIVESVPEQVAFRAAPVGFAIAAGVGVRLP